MVQTIEQIEREIITLEQAIVATAEEFHTTYSNYLAILGQAVRQQMILACYYLCTQAYPQQFLALSLNQRQQLQKGIRKLAQQIEEQLLQCNQVDANLLQTPEPVLVEEPMQIAFLSKDSLTQELPEGISEEDIRAALTQSLTLVASHQRSLQSSRQPAEQPNSPLLELIRWRNAVEQAIAETLRTASVYTNRLLEESEILPEKLPEPILEIAAKAESMNESVPGVPNILKFLVETTNVENSSEKSTQEEGLMLRKPPTPMIAVHLRLADIEFADNRVMPWRNQLRNLSSRLSALEREYQKKQYERAIAAAESAWRTIWTED